MKLTSALNPQETVAHKSADELVVRCYKVKESSLFQSGLTDPPQIFDARLLENAKFSSTSLKTLNNFVLTEKSGKFSQFQLFCSKNWKAWQNFAPISAHGKPFTKVRTFMRIARLRR